MSLEGAPHGKSRLEFSAAWFDRAGIEPAAHGDLAL
jgi:hypothetical protein